MTTRLSTFSHPCFPFSHVFIICAILLFSSTVGWTDKIDQQVLPAQPNPWESRITVGPNIHITKAHADRRQREMAICAHPTNPDELTMAVLYDKMQDQEIWNVGIYSSHDGGTTWDFNRDISHIDPTCVYGPDGIVYVMSMDGKGGVGLHRSSDYGNTWSSGGVNAPPGGFLDRPWLSTDIGSSPFRGTVYFNVTNLRENQSSHVLVYRSKGGASTIEPLVTIPGTAVMDPNSAGYTITGQIVVLRNGTVVSSHIRVGPKELREITTSQDGGRNFSAPVALTDFDSGRRRGRTPPEGVREVAMHEMPMLAVDLSDGPHHNRVYAVWPSRKTGRTQLWLTYSTDEHGERWEVPRPIDEVPDLDLSQPWLGPNHVTPAVAVNKDGVVGILWADRRDVKQPGYRARFITSLDGGVTWSRSVPVAEKASTGTFHPRHWTATDRSFKEDRAWTLTFHRTYRSENDEPGDFWALTCDAAGIFHAAWVDDRTGVAQIWTSAITVDGPVHSLVEVTRDVRIRFGEWKYDAHLNRLAVKVTITNTSEKAVEGPFVLKWIHPREHRGFVSEDPQTLDATNAENGWANVGAVWSVPGPHGSPTINPGESSASQWLEFRVRESGDAVDQGDALTVRVFVRR